MIEAGAGGRLHRSDRKSMTAAERGEGKGRGVGQGGWGGPVGSHGSVVRGDGSCGDYCLC